MKPKRPSLLFPGLRIVAFGAAAIVTLVFGAIPFLCGFLLQLLTRRKLPDIILNAAGVAVVLLLWHFTGWLQIYLGEPPPDWLSVLLSSIIGAGFAVTGGTLSRFFFPRHSTNTL